MTNQSADESNAAAKRGYARPKPRSGRFATFIWRRDAPQEISLRQECKRDDPRGNDTVVVQVEHRFKAASTGSRLSFGFFRNIKKYLQIKNLCRSKRKSKEVETLNPSRATSHETIVSVVGSVKDSCDPCQGREHPNARQREVLNRLSMCESEPEDDNRLEKACRSGNVDNVIMQCSSMAGTNVNVVPIRQQDRLAHNVATINNAIIAEPVYYDTVTEVISNAIADVPCNINKMLINENKASANLTKELLNLSKYGWYWGPLSVEQADAKLISEPDGAFLVRDSSDDRYVLTLSFKSSGNVLHSRMDHSGGLFSLSNQRENESFTSVAGLINYSMNFSQSAVICYSRPSHPGLPSFPVRLTKPVSRFMQVKSLQYLCRFVIRQNISLDNIHKMPLPEIIKLYILEAHY